MADATKEVIAAETVMMGTVATGGWFTPGCFAKFGAAVWVVFREADVSRLGATAEELNESVWITLLKSILGKIYSG